MIRKPLTLRSTVIITAALTIGTTAGTATETITTELGYTAPGAGQIATILVTLWILDKLHTLIDDTK